MDFDCSVATRAAARRAADQLFEEAVDRVAVPDGQELARAPAVQALQSLLVSVESRIAPFLAEHSSFFWLWIARCYLRPEHLAPTLHFSSRAQIRRTFDCAYAKYGRRDTADMAKNANGLWEPTALPDPLPFWTTLYLTEHLYYAASLYRRTCKGATLSFVREGTRRGMRSDASDDLEQLFVAGDRRQEKFGHPLNIWGGLAAAQNRDALDWKELPIAHANYTNQAPYGPGFLHARRLHETIAFWNHHGVRIRGVLRPSDWLELLAALTWSRWAPFRPNEEARLELLIKDLINKGYFAVASRDLEHDLFYVYFAKDWESLAPPDAAPDYSRQRTAETFLETCRKSTAEDAPIDLHTWKGMPLVWNHGTLDVIDWIGAETALTHWVTDLRYTVAEGGGAESGRVFESELRQFVRSTLGPRIQLWPDLSATAPGHKRALGGVDVDLGVIQEDTLFLVQCFIQIRRFKDLPSSEQDDQRLWTRALEKLQKVDAGAANLAAGATSRDGDELPAHIRRIVPIGCCPSVVYIRTSDPKYHLTRDIPRVCTPAELVLALGSDETVREMLAGPWVVNVSR